MRQLTNNLNKLCINADDFAQNAAIDAAIIDLAECKIINSTSALVLSPHWQQAAKRLTNLPIQVGLHLDLTSQFTHEFDCHYKLSNLIYLAYTRQLDIQHLEKVIELQWGRFCDAYGHAPDFIDGHQHVHQLPQVRDALLSIIIKKGWGLQQSQWIRICKAKHWRGLKAMIISTLGAKHLQQKAYTMGIATNSDFAGVYDFNKNSNLKELWSNWLSQLSDKHSVIMCHVAIGHQYAADEVLHDAIYDARVNEYKWLKSDGFQLLLQSKGFS